MLKRSMKIKPDEKAVIDIELDPEYQSITSDDLIVVLGNDISNTLPISYNLKDGHIYITVKGEDVLDLKQLGQPVLDVYNKTAKKMILRVIFR